MPDLDALIRAKLQPTYTSSWAMRQYRSALTAVLNLHKPQGLTVAAKTVYDCAHCRNTDWGGPDVPWPCPTVEAIAKELGIEVERA